MIYEINKKQANKGYLQTRFCRYHGDQSQNMKKGELKRALTYWKPQRKGQVMLAKKKSKQGSLTA
jgi:hypothetical protein